LPGTIRGDFCVDIGRNICHASDSAQSAKKEIALWFPKSEGIVNYQRKFIDKLFYER
jgi:nucleoside-diphosphate kinase